MVKYFSENNLRNVETVNYQKATHSISLMNLKFHLIEVTRVDGNVLEKLQELRFCSEYSWHRSHFNQATFVYG